MTYIVPEIALATRDDIVGILDLQDQNLLTQGGLLSVRLPGAFIEAALDDRPQMPLPNCAAASDARSGLARPAHTTPRDP